MVSAICRRLHDEAGVWGVFAMSAAAGVLLAVLALGLDGAALSSARTSGDAALGAALRAALHDLSPASVASGTLGLAVPMADQAFTAALRADLPAPLTSRVLLGPTVNAGPPLSLRARIAVFVPLPASGLLVPLQISEEVAAGWSGR